MSRRQSMIREALDTRSVAGLFGLGGHDHNLGAPEWLPVFGAFGYAEPFASAQWLLDHDFIRLPFGHWIARADFERPWDARRISHLGDPCRETTPRDARDRWTD